MFAQAVNVEKLLTMLRALDPGKDNLADNEEIQVRFFGGRGFWGSDFGFGLGAADGRLFAFLLPTVNGRRAALALRPPELSFSFSFLFLFLFLFLLPSDDYPHLP